MRLVDVPPFIGAAVKQLLAGEPDIDLHFCDQAAHALVLANQIAPTVILLDLIMPGMDGLALLRLLRANPLTETTPIIMLSGNDDETTRAHALDGGASDYLVKLPPKAEFIACIRRHAGGALTEEPAATDRRVIAGFRELGSRDFQGGPMEQ